MNNTRLDHSALLQCLRDENIAMAALAAIIKEEQNCLVNCDVDALSNTLTNKNEVVQQIASLELTRQAQLSALGYSAETAGMPALLQTLCADSELAVQWQDLMRISELAKTDNHTNGLLINRRMTQNQAALNILQQGSSTTSLYGSNGQSSIQNVSPKGLVLG